MPKTYNFDISWEERGGGVKTEGVGSTGLRSEDKSDNILEKPKAFAKSERIAWDDFFIDLAITVSRRTACLFHKVGCVFVDESHRIISVGYNGPSTSDLHCNEQGCAKVHGDPVSGEIRRCRGVHSEINAIINSGNTQRLKNSTLYISLFPCYDCMKALNNIGVKKIIYLDEYFRILDGSDGSKKVAESEARELANKRGIILEKYRKNSQNSINDKSKTGGDMSKSRISLTKEQNDFRR